MSGTSSAAEQLNLCALNRVRGVGPRRFAELLAKFGSATAIFAASAEQLRQAGVDSKLLEGLLDPDWAAAERDLAWLAGEQRHLLQSRDANYPRRLAEIAAAPPLLFVHGDIAALNSPQLAMVGSRSPSSGGRDLAFTLASQLAASGLTITSGLALGIDAAAHRGALDVQGATIAVAGTGLDQVYPARHRDLAYQIIDAGGALVSEFPVGTGPVAQNFPRRNRIISGLSLGTLVVEAALQSGSLITARYAVEQGREVFAVPGSIHNPLARGCHALLREGARLVESVADIVAELTWGSEGKITDNQCISEAVNCSAGGCEELAAEHRLLLDQLGFDPATVDELVDRTGLTARELSSMLLILELKGYVSSQAGGAYVRQGSR